MKKMLRFGFLIPLFALSLVLGGCGSDGKDGVTTTIIDEREIAATPASYDVQEHQPTQLLMATISDVRVESGVISVDFKVDGLPNPNAVEAEFTIAKWSAADNSWVSMLQRNRTRANNVPVVRASNLRPAEALLGSVGAFNYTFNHGGSNIDFTQGAYWTNAEPTAEGAYGVYVEGIVDAVKAAAAWDAEATYRIGVTGINPTKFTAVAYVDGAGNVVADIPQMVSAETLMSCLDCHGEANIEGQTQFNFHGNQRHDPQLCTTCHNNFTYEAWNSTQEVGGWQIIDLMTMTHTIHAGIGETYFESSEGRWADTRFPDWTFGRNSGPKNCTACHKGDIPEANETWNTVTLNTCISCHTGDDLSGGVHPDIEAIAIANCAGCHGVSATSAEEFHEVATALEKLAVAREYTLEVVSVENAVAAANPIITWRLKRGDTYQDLFNADGSISAAVGARLAIGWGYGDDFTNDGSGVSSNGDGGRPVNVGVGATNTVRGVNATYAITTFPNPLPTAAAEGRFGYVALERGPTGINVNTTVKTFDLGIGVVNDFTERRQIVDAASCVGCHTDVLRHNTYANVDVITCVVCHNAGSHSRTVNPASGIFGTVDFMYLIHGIHSVGETRDSFVKRYVAGDGYNNSPVTYPSTMANCTTCHINDSHKVIDTSKRLGVYSDGLVGVLPPGIATCTSCHGTDSPQWEHYNFIAEQKAAAASFEDPFKGNANEACAVCH